MLKTLKVSETTQTDEQLQKYFSFRIKGWTNFDLTDNTLLEIAERIEQDSGFLTLIEVLRAEDDLASIRDEEREKMP